MKNMFKMMGVALLAGAMLFTACKKDKEDTTPAATPAAIADGATVNFGGTSWTSNVASAITQNNMLQITAYKEQGRFPGIQVKTTAEEGSISGSTAENPDDYGLTFSPENTFVNYFAVEAVESYGDWEPLTYNIKVTKFDATNFKLTAEVSATMFDYKSYYNDEVASIQDAAKKSLTATFGNITLGAAN